MKTVFFAVLFLSNVAHASLLKELKIDQKWKIKYDANAWDYFYLKPFGGISSHLFENKKEKFKLILQRETHAENQKNYDSLISSKCAEANDYYSKNKSGLAIVEKINGTKTCYIEYKNVSGKKISEFVYPEKSTGKNYELYTYVWSSTSVNSKKSVISFLQGFIK